MVYLASQRLQSTLIFNTIVIVNIIIIQSWIVTHYIVSDEPAYFSVLSYTPEQYIPHTRTPPTYITYVIRKQVITSNIEIVRWLCNVLWQYNQW